MAIMTGLARLGGDAKIRYAGSGDAVCNLSLAFSYGRKGDDGLRPTQWVDAALWGKRAEALAPYLLKGWLVDVVLQDVHIEAYEGKNGPGHKLAAKVLEIELAGVKPDGEVRADRPAENPQHSHATAPARAPANPAAGTNAFADMDDDIPF